MKTSTLGSLACSVLLLGLSIGGSAYAGDRKNEDAKADKTTNDKQGRVLSSEKVEKEATVEKKGADKETERETRRPFHHTGALENRQ